MPELAGKGGAAPADSREETRPVHPDNCRPIKMVHELIKDREAGIRALRCSQIASLAEPWAEAVYDLELDDLGDKIKTKRMKHLQNIDSYIKMESLIQLNFRHICKALLGQGTVLDIVGTQMGDSWSLTWGYQLSIPTATSCQYLWARLDYCIHPLTGPPSLIFSQPQLYQMTLVTYSPLRVASHCLYFKFKYLTSS